MDLIITTDKASALKLIQHALMIKGVTRIVIEGNSPPPNDSGYINKHGVRVPNPCCEIDMQGRDLDKVGRNLRPGQTMADYDAILADPEST